MHPVCSNACIQQLSSVTVNARLSQAQVSVRRQYGEDVFPITGCAITPLAQLIRTILIATWHCRELCMPPAVQQHCNVVFSETQGMSYSL